MTGSADACLSDDAWHAQVRLALSGDAHAYAAVVRATQRGVAGLALAIVGDVAASEDIAQEAYLRGWRDRDRVRDADAFLPWLRQIVRNLARDHLRSRRRQRYAGVEERDSALETLPDPQPDAEQRLSRDQQWSAVREAIDALPETSRETLLVYYREDEDSARTGRLLGVSPEAVRQRVSRARRDLRERVLAMLDDGLRRSAPGPGFTAAVSAAIGGTLIASTAPTAAAASVGVAGWLGAGKYGAGQGTLALLGHALAGVLSGIAVALAGALLGIRLRGPGAVRRDDPCIRIVVEIYAVAATLAFAAGVVAGARLERVHWWHLPLLFAVALAIGALMARAVPPVLVRVNRLRWVLRLGTRIGPQSPARLRLAALLGALAGAGAYLLAVGWIGR